MVRIRIGTICIALALSLAIPSGEAGAVAAAPISPPVPQMQAAQGDVVLVGRRGARWKKRLARRHWRRHRAYRVYRHRGAWRTRPARVIIIERYPSRRAAAWGERRARAWREPEARPRRRAAKPERQVTAEPEVKKTVRHTAVKPKEKPQRIAKAEPESPRREKKLALANPVKSAPRIDCGEAASILGGYGFSDVRPTQCEGDQYLYEAKRDGDRFSVSLNAKDGELAKVAKQAPADPEQWANP